MEGKSIVTLTYEDWARDSTGAGVQNIRARVYEVMLDGSINGTHTAEAFSDVNGKWTLTPDSASSESGMYAVEIKNTTTGETEWRRPDIQIQLENLVGADGNAPLADSSVVAAKLASNAVTAAKILDGAVTDPKIGNRTIAEASPASDTGTLSNLLNYLAYQVQQITGEADWKTAPATSLAAGGSSTATALDLPESSAGWNFDETLITATTLTTSYSSSSFVAVAVGVGTYLIIASASFVPIGDGGLAYISTDHSVHGVDVGHDAFKAVTGFDYMTHISRRTFTSAGTLEVAVKAGASNAVKISGQCNLFALKIS